MMPTLQRLLATPGLGLHLVTAPDEGATEALSRPIGWVHSSDLVDPTPFLDPGQLLLTDGSQFHVSGSRRDRFSEYVSRLTAHGIVGLGFGTQVIHAQVPAGLVDACDREGLPLVEVPDRTPFIAIIRHVADLLAKEQNARMEWSLKAQRSIAKSALRPDGLKSILRELEVQLDCWAVLLDASGTVVESPTRGPLPQSVTEGLTLAAKAALRRGTRAAGQFTVDGQDIVLQTLGQQGKLRGVLALGELANLDPAGTDLVTSVIALASLALEQSRALDASRRHLRSGLLQLLIAGEVVVADQTAVQVWGGLPAEPISVAAFRPPPEPQSLNESLELLAEQTHGDVVFAPFGENWVLLCGPAHSERALTTLLTEVDSAGRSSAPLSGLAVGLEEASRALIQALDTGATLVEFDEILGAGMLGLLRQANPEPVARKLLSPLLDRDDVYRLQLIPTLRAWFDHNCSWDAPADQLGIHRHTLRNRINAAGRILELNLDGMSDRLELWTALQFIGPGVGTASSEESPD